MSGYASAAEYKPFQLLTAAECGLRVPDTIITNDPRDAAAFARETPEGTVYKPLSSGPFADAGNPVVLFTVMVNPDECGTPSVGTTAHLFQAWVPKMYDVRVNVVGTACLAVAIQVPRSSPGYIDWRSDYAANHYEPVEIPSPVRIGIQSMMQRLGLVFGAFDFVVSPAGEWFFLEVNPNGEWGWLEGKAGSIAAAIADVLEEADQQHE